VAGSVLGALAVIIGEDLWSQRGWTAVLLSWVSAIAKPIAAMLWPHGFYMLILIAVAIAFWRKLSELRDIQLRYPGIWARPPWSYVRYDKKKGNRWENIRTIKFGHIRYPGLLTYDQTDYPEGFGIKIIREVFNTKQYQDEIVKITPNPTKSHWKNVLEELDAGDFNIIATPMLETFERTTKADFTMPMFFSNIGLYVSAEAVGAGLDGRGGLKDETLDSLVAKLSQRDDALEIQYVPGEISEKQGRKLYDRLAESMKERVTLKNAGDLIGNMLEDVESRSATLRLAFCESFHVQICQHYEERPYRLINILTSYHILYPVCYAIRNGDYMLRNRVNIGLLKMTAEGDGIVRRLSEAMKVSKDSLQAHFVSNWTDPRTRSMTKGKPA
jgi:hypothetical protein